MLEALVRRFLYYPTRLERDTPLPAHARGAVEVWIDTADGNRIHGLYWPPPEGRPTLLFFHGNAQSVFEWAWVAEDLAPLASGLLLIDYPGYGKSSGTPHEAALYAAGHAALAWLTKCTPVGRVVIFGKSLGGPIAVEVAADRQVLGVILESTFRSVPRVARYAFPLFPAGAVMRSERYETEARLTRVRAAVLVIHGTRDELIPAEEGRALYELANEPREFYWVEGAGHNDVSVVAGAAYGRRLSQWLDAIEAH